MEKELFDWAGWDPLGEMSFVFYTCTLKVDLSKEYKKGVIVPSIEVDYENSEMILYADNGAVLYRGKLKLQIV